MIRRLILLMLGWTAVVQADSILNSKHDLSVAGPGPIKAVTETEVCSFCHTPHRAIPQTPLWSHELSTATYIPYSSSTAKATFGQPTGSSKLCLSCHDGTVALGMVRNRTQPIEMQSNITTLPVGASNLRTDLSDDHPISFIYDSALASANGQLKDPGTLIDKVRLDHNNQLQCTACHDPHDNQFGQFLVQKNTASALCVACHVPTGWETATHRNSAKTWTGTGTDPWPHTTETTVAANGCENCHAPHNAGTGPRLLNFAGEEANCYPCHNGNVAAKNIQSEFAKASVHPVDLTTGVHDPTEDPINPSTRHVECVDCHNPHASNTSPATVPNASGALAGVTGVNKDKTIVMPVAREYELCFRCHADSNNRGPSRVTRQFPETNLRLKFATSNASYHPIEAAGKNPSVPSLLSPMTASTLIYCTDCHNNDQGPGNGGTGPKGPHGSQYVPLLERRQETTDNQPESAAIYDLCYKCHSRTSILADESFPLHKLHVDGQQAACTTCHDSHGVASQSHLINFNTMYVTKSSGGLLEYNSTGLLSGNCSLTCHGHDHNPSSYAPAGALPQRAPRLNKPRR
jgi:predicted CXXCH cytochrome family protein